MRVARTVLLFVVVVTMAVGCADSARYDLGQDEVPTSVPLTTTIVEVDESLVGAVVTTTTTIPDNVVEHVIEPGDALYDLAIFYGSTVAEIVAANGIADPGALTVGEAVLIPTSDR